MHCSDGAGWTASVVAFDAQYLSSWYTLRRTLSVFEVDFMFGPSAWHGQGYKTVVELLPFAMKKFTI
ncbi:hypothetical protein N9B88_01510 [Rubripirellula sp.]|jgi:hypothetical protein|nr:hypothetical protein [Rubripirellula sp.]